MKIVADENIPYIRGVFEPYAQVEYMRGMEIGAADVRDADALLVRTRTLCNEALLGGSKVSCVATATIGTDHIDLPWCAASGVEVISAPGCNAGGVLQWIAGALARLSDREGWRPCEKRLGVVGVGNVGSLIVRYGRLWGFDVVCSDPPRELREGLTAADGFLPFAEIAGSSDIVTFHVPMERAGEFPTYRLAGERFFGALKQGAHVINTSRGDIVDETPLRKAVASGKCSCSIDTWSGEPDIDRELLDMAFNATAHIAGYSAQGKANASAAIVAGLSRHFGLPLAGWYPPDAHPVKRAPITWEELKSSITDYFDIAAETGILKSNPGQFEWIREQYNYREEYF